MMIATLLLFVGLLLVFLEFFLPGGIMGTAGGLIIVGSVVLFALDSDSPIAVFLFVVGALLSLALVIKFALWRIQHSKSRSGLFSLDDQSGYRAPAFDETLIGKTGTVLTDLKPSGHVLIAGTRCQGISQSGYILKDTEVVVIGGKEAYLIVKPTSIGKEP